MKFVKFVLAPALAFSAMSAGAAPVENLLCESATLKVKFSPSRTRASVWTLSGGKERRLAKLSCKESVGETFFYDLGGSISVQARVIRSCQEMNVASQNAALEFELIELAGGKGLKGGLYKTSLAGPIPVADFDCK